MPPVALTTATATALITQTAPQPAVNGAQSGVRGVLAPRPLLRLVGSEQVDGSEGPAEVVHGWGGPVTCNCRPCAMARHPASMPRLRVVD
ncbi:hypothetical protein FrEUN1fDRAFT_3175 [Parafrankia sp. EUN1f]|nr:hypothetical protein FrEUN1fDRAFT_3175 [Parafrankia sp. EUN1f]